MWLLLVRFGLIFKELYLCIYLSVYVSCYDLEYMNLAYKLHIMNQWLSILIQKAMGECSAYSSLRLTQGQVCRLTYELAATWR